MIRQTIVVAHWRQNGSQFETPRKNPPTFVQESVDFFLQRSVTKIQSPWSTSPESETDIQLLRSRPEIFKAEHLL
jgi:hypothetical protein